MRHSPGETFEHPHLAAVDPLRTHVVYRICPHSRMIVIRLSAGRESATESSHRGGINRVVGLWRKCTGSERRFRSARCGVALGAPPRFEPQWRAFEFDARRRVIERLRHPKGERARARQCFGRGLRIVRRTLGQMATLRGRTLFAVG